MLEAENTEVRALTLRAWLRSSHVGAIGTALALWAAVSQSFYVLTPILSSGCIKFINYFIRRDAYHGRVLRDCSILWKYSVGEFWLAFATAAIAIFFAFWVCFTDKES